MGYMTFSGANGLSYSAAAVGSGDFTALVWAYRDSSSGNHTCLILGSQNAGHRAWWANYNSLARYTYKTTNIGNHGGTTAAIWQCMAMRYTAETGGGGNGVAEALIRTDGTPTWTKATLNSQTDPSIGTNLHIGHMSASEYLTGRIALVKVWSGSVLTDGELLTESQYNNMQITTNQFACYYDNTNASGFKTDKTGNGRNLSDVGTAPTWASGGPTDILGDDPSASVTTRRLINGGLINAGLINNGLIS